MAPALSTSCAAPPAGAANTAALPEYAAWIAAEFPPAPRLPTRLSPPTLTRTV